MATIRTIYPKRPLARDYYGEYKSKAYDAVLFENLFFNSTLRISLVILLSAICVIGTVCYAANLISIAWFCGLVLLPLSTIGYLIFSTNYVAKVLISLSFGGISSGLLAVGDYFAAGIVTPTKLIEFGLSGTALSLFSTSVVCVWLAENLYQILRAAKDMLACKSSIKRRYMLRIVLRLIRNTFHKEDRLDFLIPANNLLINADGEMFFKDQTGITYEILFFCDDPSGGENKYISIIESSKEDDDVSDEITAYVSRYTIDPNGDIVCYHPRNDEFNLINEHYENVFSRPTMCE